MTDEEIDLEREKTESFELGHLSELENIAAELRDRAGEIYGHSDSHTDFKKAKQLKDLAKEFEERAEEKRERWEDKYK